MSEKILDNTTLTAEQHAPESVKYHDWQPIESAPKDRMPILVCDDGIIVVCVWYDPGGYVGYSGPGWYLAQPFSRWDGDDFVLFSEDGPFHVTPTHWMPLPEPPTDK